jgi:hypothetical protein
MPEHPIMANLLHNRPQKTSPKVTVHFSTWFIQNKTLSIPASWMQVFHTKNRWDIENFALYHDGISFDKILSKQLVILGQELTETIKYRTWAQRSERHVAV